MNHSAARPLPSQPSLEFLRDQAKRLLRQLRKGDPEALLTLRNHHPGYKNSPKRIEDAALHDAQLVIARQHGFASWSRLKEEIEARKNALQSSEELLLASVWRGRLEDVENLLNEPHRFSAETLKKLSEALAGIADRSVWYRPHYRTIGRALISAGVECSIWTAARLGLQDQVQKCLALSPELLNCHDSLGRTPLQRAALIYGSDPGCEALTDWLIQNDAQVDIFTAAAFSMQEHVEAELKRDPSLVHRKCQGSTPLNWAVRPRRHRLASAPQSTDAETCKILLDQGAHLESQDDQENGMHPLHHVGEWCGSRESAALLIERGANLCAVDDIGWTPLDYAINRNREQMITILKGYGAKQTLIDWPNTWGERRNLIFASVKRNDLKSVERLLAEEPGLAQARAEGGESPLHWAAHDGHYEIAETLLRHGAEVSVQETSYWGGTPLHWAAERQPVLAGLLLDHGAEINSLNQKTGQTPLHYCARCDDVPEVAELLLARGADPEIKDHKGHTPLDYAIKTNHEQVAAVLNRKDGKIS